MNSSGALIRLRGHFDLPEKALFLLPLTGKPRSCATNGYLPKREVLTGLRPVTIKVPKVRSRTEEVVVFRSSLVPPYVRRAKALDVAVPWLYLKGISTGQMAEALAALAGPQAKGRSAAMVGRLKAQWSGECETWCQLRLNKERCVYWRADGILRDERARRLPVAAGD